MIFGPYFVYYAPLGDASSGKPYILYYETVINYSLTRVTSLRLTPLDLDAASLEIPEPADIEALDQKLWPTILINIGPKPDCAQKTTSYFVITRNEISQCEEWNFSKPRYPNLADAQSAIAKLNLVNIDIAYKNWQQKHSIDFTEGLSFDLFNALIESHQYGIMKGKSNPELLHHIKLMLANTDEVINGDRDILKHIAFQDSGLAIETRLKIIQEELTINLALHDKWPSSIELSPEELGVFSIALINAVNASGEHRRDHFINLYQSATAEQKKILVKGPIAQGLFTKILKSKKVEPEYVDGFLELATKCTKYPMVSENRQDFTAFIEDVVTQAIDDNLRTELNNYSFYSSNRSRLLGGVINGFPVEMQLRMLQLVIQDISPLDAYSGYSVLFQELENQEIKETAIKMFFNITYIKALSYKYNICVEPWVGMTPSAAKALVKKEIQPKGDSKSLTWLDLTEMCQNSQISKAEFQVAVDILELKKPPAVRNKPTTSASTQASAPISNNESVNSSGEVPQPVHSTQRSRPGIILSRNIADKPRCVGRSNLRGDCDKIQKNNQLFWYLGAVALIAGGCTLLALGHFQPELLAAIATESQVFYTGVTLATVGVFATSALACSNEKINLTEALGFVH